MKKIITYNGYSYYIGEDKNGVFYNIVPKDQKPPTGGYAKEWILGVKKLPDLFSITPQEIKKLKQAKKELLTDSQATPSSQSRNNNYLLEVATKYKANIQYIFDSIK